MLFINPAVSIVSRARSRYRHRCFTPPRRIEEPDFTGSWLTAALPSVTDSVRNAAVAAAVGLEPQVKINLTTRYPRDIVYPVLSDVHRRGRH